MIAAGTGERADEADGRVGVVTCDRWIVAEFVDTHTRRTARRCVGVCVAVPGMLRESDGFLSSALHLGWTDVPFSGQVADRLSADVPVATRRGSTLAALAEYRYGAGRGAAEADGRALLQAAGLRRESGLDTTIQIDQVLADAAAGVPDARGATESTARRLADGMVGLVNTLSPERIVLTGFLARLYRAAPDVVDGRLIESSVVARTGRVTVTTGDLPHPVLLGAADTAFEPLLADPRTALSTD